MFEDILKDNLIKIFEKHFDGDIDDIFRDIKEYLIENNLQWKILEDDEVKIEVSLWSKK